MVNLVILIILLFKVIFKHVNKNRAELCPQLSGQSQAPIQPEQEASLDLDDIEELDDLEEDDE